MPGSLAAGSGDVEDVSGKSGAAIPPIAFVLLLLLVATMFQGAFAVRQWAPLALFVLVALAAASLAGGAVLIRSSVALVALGGLWAFAGWSVLSVLWADAPQDALESSLRDCLYAGVFTLPLVTTVRPESLRQAGGFLIAGLGLLAFGTLVALLLNPTELFLAGRLQQPIGYRNATALLFALGFWPLICVAARHESSRALRGVALAAAVLGLGLAFLTQSRGVVVGVIVGGVVVMALGPDRVRRAWLAVAAAGLLAAASGGLLTPYDAFVDGKVVGAEEIRTAASALVAVTAAGFAVGLLVAVFDRGLRTEGKAVAVLRLVARVGLVVFVGLGSVGALVAVGDPVGTAQAKWDEFRALETVGTGRTRLTTTSGQRYDLWRVAVEDLRDNPVLGVGRANYAQTYYLGRKNDRNLDIAHGLPFEVGSELGGVGLALLAIFLGGIGVVLARGWRRLPRSDRQLASGLAAAGAVMLGQSMVDWMWRIPGIIAIGLLGLSLAVGIVLRHGAPAPPHAPLPWRGRVLRAAPLLVLALTVCSLYLGAYFLDRARGTRNPDVRLESAKAAARVLPLGLPPIYLQASALESMGRTADARAKLDAALRDEPDNIATIGLLGDFEARRGRYAAAAMFYRRALALNPLDVGLQQLTKTGGRP